MNPKVVERDTKAYKNLRAVAAMLEATSPRGYRYEVRDVYFDYGQDWMWTTIICTDPSKESEITRSWQVPCPRDWAKVLMADSLAELVECTEIIMGGEHFLDS